MRTELTRVKALAEKTVSNGCTEAEAMAAAEMVCRLRERYALSMEERYALPIGSMICSARVTPASPHSARRVPH